MTPPKAKFAGLALIAALCAGFTLGLTAPAGAGVDEGWAAYNRGDYATAVREWRPLAKRGHAEVQNILGFMYSKGRGVPQDYTETMGWWRKAADQGYAEAQYNLAILYFKGIGVPQDYAQAVKWFRKAAEQGNAQAQNNLGAIYFNGYGVGQDYVRAYMWFNLAASSFHPDRDRNTAAKYRYIIAKRMTPAQIAEAEKLAREWRPKK